MARPEGSPPAPPRRPELVVLVASAAALALEVGLLRLFTLAHFHHFASLSVSVALLGFGAGGTALVARPQLARPLLSRPAVALLVQASVVLVSYLLLNHLPLDTFQLAWSRSQWALLAAYYLALVAPFLWTGLLVAAAFAAHPTVSHRLYMANLLGSAAGAGAALPAQALPGGWGALAVAVAFPLLGALAHRPRLAAPATAVLLLALLLQPEPLSPRLSPHKRLPQLLLQPEARLLLTRWGPTLRVDVLQAPTIRSAPGLSLSYTAEVPAGLGLTVDGEALSVLAQGAGAYTQALPEALAFRLARPSSALILQPRGGLPVALALEAGVERVVALEQDPLLARTAREQAAVLRQPAVEVRAGGIRAELARLEEGFPLVLVPLPDSFLPVTAGSYSLGESYVYTLQAFRSLWKRVEPGGFLAVSRWLQLPPSEELRAWALVVEATGGDPESLAALRSFQTALILAKKGRLSPAERQEIRRFAARWRFDLVYLPDLDPAEANRFHLLPQPVYARTFSQLLERSDREALYRVYPFDVRPPTDDQPYFFHLFKPQQWAELRARLGKTYEPFAGAGVLLLVGLVAASAAAAGALILAPAALLGSALPLRAPPLLYFLSLGAGYLFVEIALLVWLILLLGHAAPALAVALVGLLAASSLGSLLSVRLPLGLPPVLLVPAAVALPTLLGAAAPAWLPLPFGLRVAAALGLVLPLGLLMGMPFPQGLARVAVLDPRWVPWAWAINGASSVLSALVANLIAVEAGLSALLLAAGLAYALAALTAPRLAGGRPAALSSPGAAPAAGERSAPR